MNEAGCILLPFLYEGRLAAVLVFLVEDYLSLYLSSSIREGREALRPQEHADTRTRWRWSLHSPSVDQHLSSFAPNQWTFHRRSLPGP